MCRTITGVGEIAQRARDVPQPASYSWSALGRARFNVFVEEPVES